MTTMGKNIKWLSLLLISGMLCCWTACSDDNESTTEEPIEDNDEAESMTRQDSLNIAFMNVIGTLCQTDSTFYEQEDLSGIYSPEYGIVLYTVLPTVRYKMAESAEDAKGQFHIAFATAIEFAGANENGNTVCIDLGEKGRIEFERTQSEGYMGVLNVDIPQIPDLTQVVWLQTEAWPQNAGDGGTYVGQTFKSSDGKRWVCVQTPNGGSEYGLLVTFDDYGWLQKQFDPLINSGAGKKKNKGYDQLTQGYNLKYGVNNAHKYWQSWLHWYASSNDLLMLNRFMYNENGTRNENATDVFSNTAFMASDRYKAIYGQNRYYCCGDHTWAILTKNKYKYEYYYYSQRAGEWKVDFTEKHPYTFMGNRWYVMNSNWHNSILKDDRWNSYYCKEHPGHTQVLRQDEHGHWNWTAGNDYEEWNFRNFDKKDDHNTYIKVKTYHFYSDFYNVQTGKYKDGFVNFDTSGRR